MAGQPGPEQDTDWLTVFLDEQTAGSGLEAHWSASTGRAAEVPVSTAGIDSAGLPATSLDDVPLPDVAAEDVDLGFLDSILEGENLDASSHGFDFGDVVNTSALAAGGAPTLQAAAGPAASPTAACSPGLPQVLQQQPALSGGSSAHSGYPSPLLLQPQQAGSPAQGASAPGCVYFPHQPQQQLLQQTLLPPTPMGAPLPASCSPAGSEASPSGAVAGGGGLLVTPLPAVRAAAVGSLDAAPATTSSSSGGGGAVGSCPSSPPATAGSAPLGFVNRSYQGAINCHGPIGPAQSMGGTPPSVPEASAPDDAEDEERKRQARMQRNRESAHLSRQRKKMQVEELERKNTELGTQVKYFGGLVAQLGQENAALRHHLVAICQQTGTPLPPVATSPPPGVAPLMPMPPGAVPVPGQVPIPGMSMPMPPGMVPATGGVGVVLPMPYGYAAKLPISKLPEPARPAPAKPSSASNGTTSVKVEARAAATGAHAAVAAAASVQAAAGQAAAGPARKRARATGGALLALFALFMLAGPSPSTMLLSSSATRGNAPAVVEPYAAAAAASAGGAVHAGRVLASVVPLNSSSSPPPGATAPQPSASTPAATLPSSPPAAETNTSLVPAGTDAALAHALALLPAPDAEAESVALQRLVDAGEAALVWDPSWAAAAAASGLDFGGGNGGALLPLWGDFPSLLGSAFRADGLLAPIGCEKVFEIDASHVPGHAKLKRRMDSWLSSAQGFRGRAVPLPPASTEPAPHLGHSSNPNTQPPGDSGGPHIGAAGPGGTGDILVSIVLPARHNAGGTGTPTPGEPGAGDALGPGLAGGGSVLASLERIFVVVLQQSAVYATYSCQLPRLGAASAAA